MSEIKLLIEKYINDEITLEKFKIENDSISKKFPLFGFKGIAGQMFFNLLYNNSNDLGKINELNQILKNIIKSPENIDDAKNKIEVLKTFNDKINQNLIKNKKARSGSIPFFLSYFWSIQRTEIWPIFYHSIKSFFHDIFSVDWSNDFAENYDKFYTILQEIQENCYEKFNKKISFWDIEHSIIKYNNENNKIQVKLNIAEEKYLSKINCNDSIKKTYQEAKNEILKWDNNVKIGITNSYISFKLKTIFTYMIFKEDKINVWINLRKSSKINDSKKFAKLSQPIIGTIEHDKPIYSFYLYPNKNNDYALDLIKQAYHDKLDYEGPIPHNSKIWLLAPEENAKYWNEYKKRSIISIGWDLGDLSNFESKDEILKAIRKKYSDSNPKIASNMVYSFYNEMNVGDIVFARKGRSSIVGYGKIVSDYYYSKDFQNIGTHANIRKVKWIKFWDENERFLPKSVGIMPMNTLVNITNNQKYNDLFKIICDDEFDDSTIKKLYADRNKFKNKLKNKLYGIVLNQYINLVNRFINFVGKNNIKYDEISMKTIDNFLETLNIVKSTNDTYRYILRIFLKSSRNNEDIDDDLPFIENQPYTKGDFLNDVVFLEKNYDKLVNLIRRKKNIILQGSPGVGKTFIAKRLAYSIMGEKDENRVEFVQFHQSYSYEDFIQGYRPSGDGFELNNGVFYNFCNKAAEDPENDYYFIIDEINRGNISKIFGELMMLIEEDKRGEDFGIHLTYSDEGPKFFVPENVYIIGMMNTADRSLAIIDYALRRRFVFYLIPPLFDEDSENNNIFKNHLIDKKKVDKELATKLIDRFRKLNKLILNDEDLGYGFRIGHSYFCGKNIKDDNWYNSIINYEIAPLLKEYWFDDLKKAEREIEKLSLNR